MDYHIIEDMINRLDNLILELGNSQTVPEDAKQNYIRQKMTIIISLQFADDHKEEDGYEEMLKIIHNALQRTIAELECMLE